MGATGTLSFGLWMTLPKSFKVRVDLSSPVLIFCLHANNPQSHLWLVGPGIELGSLTNEASTIAFPTSYDKCSCFRCLSTGTG